jgi:hypothetical protein
MAATHTPVPASQLSLAFASHLYALEISSSHSWVLHLLLSMQKRECYQKTEYIENILWYTSSL